MAIKMDRKYSLDDFINIVEALRSENGCPWDRVQTHGSLKPCMMEEAAELLASIRIYDKTGNAENMREELGDILLQVVMHAQIAKEEKLFTLEDVIHEISEKMVRRHPHVFGDMEANDHNEIRDNWEEIKKKEKEGKDWIESPLREIPRELPSLVRASKVLKKMDKLYGISTDYSINIDNMRENIEKLAKYNPGEKAEGIDEIIGDIMLQIADISRQYKVNAEQLLNDRIEDMIDKCESIEKP
ncbi:MazG family protein [Kineothrix sp. MB12-C1]|uniref:MazG family protein n=1 Tax=Kineothrix sp. MB12-C1 TaxID=3070215 RepID=UPI0027D30A71|nr:MazG family protein [Kineothrix sp. MB12-C1]WMC91202.1 MazG family protein [Kineothrix sp. MB12-C1]